VSLLPNPTWFVGCGNMAGALVEGWRSAGVDLAGAVVIRPSGRIVEGVRTVVSFADAGPPPRLVVLGFKPQQLDEIAPQLAPWLSSRTAVVSLLAGVEAASLRARFPNAAAVVRAMPNLAVAVRRGVVALYGEAEGELREQISQAIAQLGWTMWAQSEAVLAGIGAVAGAGPAYVSRFIRSLAKAGQQRGLSEQIAATVALETVFGTAWLAASTGESMDSLAARVASPRGTTEAGLAVLDGDLDGLIAETIEAAAERGAELAAQARTGSQVDSPPTLH